MKCRFLSLCSGCDFNAEPLSAQRQQKAERLGQMMGHLGALPPLEVAEIPGEALRDRLDFQVQNGKIGLFHKDPSLGILDLSSCAQLSVPLQDWYQQFRARPLPLKRASFRLRVSPQGQRGLWIDAANVDIKDLLDEGLWLKSWKEEDVFIEMGQRRKAVQIVDHKIKLHNPSPQPWFQTHYKDLPVNLYGTVGSFTQPSLFANQFISKWIQAKTTMAKNIVELGAGQGNLSFPALSSGASLVACDSEEMALDGFQISLQQLADRGIDLRPKVRFFHGDLIGKKNDLLAGADFLIANPPRRGLGKMLLTMSDAKDLRHVLYMSCYPEGLALDASAVQKMGFQLTQWCLLDQFPQTRHMEVLTLWSR